MQIIIGAILLQLSSESCKQRIRRYLMIVNWREKIRVVLNVTGMPQTELARRAGVRYQTWQRWMAQTDPQGRPDCDECARLSEVLGISMDVLFKDALELPAEISLKVQSKLATNVLDPNRLLQLAPSELRQLAQDGREDAVRQWFAEAELLIAELRVRDQPRKRAPGTARSTGARRAGEKKKRA